MSNKNLIRTAIYSKDYCFICRTSRFERRLYQVKELSIKEAYIQHRIYIKHETRVCHRHLDQNGLIANNQFEKIRTKAKKQKKEIILMLNYLSFGKSNENKGVFEKFSDMDSLSEEHCFKITGWTKDEFTRFSNFITRINDTNGRSKEELIALYRYWLRKGSDQTTLAFLFKTKTSQQKISHYLQQIRQAIHQEFVPFFLGTENRDRTFFLAHNNKMTSDIHKLNPDTLAVVADATYTKIEKSKNNQFQYLCFSGQKKDHLIKPFLISCADGYIIDLYGPFEAVKNDATILSEILTENKDLNRILQPSKTVIFLDRGFRDIILLLMETYKFTVKIPTCKQFIELNDENENNNKLKQLTIEQTSATRLVTKTRFIVEKQFGNLKNKKALDNIRNTEVGHIMIDYRNACAMINFTHKSCNPDKEFQEEIAKKILERFEIKENPLDFFLTKQFDTKQITECELEDIVDFPKLNSKELVKDFFLGTYQMTLCTSYLKDFVENGKIYIIQQQLKNQVPNADFRNELLKTNLIGVEIISRHRRSEIKSVTLKKRKKKETLTDRYRTVYKVFLQYDPELNSIKTIKNYICNCMSGARQIGSCVHVATLIYYLAIAKHNIIKTPANHLLEIFSNKSTSHPEYIKNMRQSKMDAESSLISFAEFKYHVPKWGGEIKENDRKIKLFNTCTIDYFLFSLWYLSKINFESVKLLSSTQTHFLKQIVSNINDFKWNQAKEIWIKKFIKLNLDNINKISLEGSENQYFIDHIIDNQKYKIMQKCDQNCVLNNTIVSDDSSNYIFFNKVDHQVKLFAGYQTKCIVCNQETEGEILFDHAPNFIFIESREIGIYLDELPNQLAINNKNYKFLSATLIKPGHFLGAYEFKKKYYIVDDLDRSVKILNEKSKKDYPTSISIYFLK